MSKIISFLEQSYIGSIIGITGIIAGFIIGLMFYLKSRVIAKPQYFIKTEKLIDLSSGIIPRDLIMHYKDKQVTFLKKTTIKFWNTGKKTIDRDDLVPEIIKVDFSKENASIFHILDYSVVNKSRDIIEVNFKEDDEKMFGFSFNYLDHKDFFEIQVLHSGKYEPICISGNVKGVPRGLINRNDAYQNAMKKVENSMLFTSSILSTSNLMTVSLIGLLSLFNRKKK